MILTISGIPGDDVAAIASGPIMADPDRNRDFTALADRLRSHISEAAYGLLVGPTEKVALASGPSDVRLIATPRACLRAAAQVASEAGVDVMLLGDDLEGESRSRRRSD
jgi:Putative glycerate kinase